MRAAASSMASGNPSRRTQISAMVRVLAGVNCKSGLAVCAHSRKSATAAYCARASPSGRWVRSGSASGGTGNSCSPRRCRTARLVTRILSPGQLVSSHLQTHARFADATGACEGDQADLWLSEEGRQRLELVCTSNQPGELSRQVVEPDVQLVRSKFSFGWMFTGGVGDKRKECAPR